MGMVAHAADTKPNVVVIFADDLGYGDVGCYGATKLKTPNIDRLASQGRIFTDAHSASAVCTPSRYALITGEYPVRKNLYLPVFLKTGLVIDTKQQTVASLMKDAGYATACIGKWHLGFGKERPEWNGELKPGPLELGFDYYFGVPIVNSHPPFVYVENHKVVGLVPDDPFVFGKKAKTREFPEKMGLTQIGGADAAHALYDDEQVATKLTEKAVEWIKEKKAGPFFLYLATTNIHHPFTPHPRFKGTSECGPYGDFVHELDWIVGEIMTVLDETGTADNTLVVFTSDNGGMFNMGGQAAWQAGHTLNGKLLGFKFDAWEGGHRVPFIVRWPGKVKAGSKSDQVICNVDLFATLAAVIGTQAKEGQGQDSVNVLPAWVGDPEKPVREYVMLAARQPSHLGVRKGKWMYIGAGWPSAGLHATAANTVAFIEENKDQPFFVNVWLHESHTPHNPTPESMEKWKHLDEQKQVYSAVITDGDNAVGLILDALKRESLADNTIVMFSSDNGPEWTHADQQHKKMGGGYGSWASIGQTGGLRGKKRSLYEGGVRVPFIVRWPGHTPAGVTDTTTVLTAVDLLPTLCAAAAVKLPADYQGDGENLLPALQGKAITRTRPIFWEWRGPKPEPDWWPRFAVRDGDWKLLMTEDAKRVELHNLKTDRAEEAGKDLSKAYPKIVARLTKMTLDWKVTLPTKVDPNCVSPKRGAD